MDYALQFYRHLVEQHGTTPKRRRRAKDCSASPSGDGAKRASRDARTELRRRVRVARLPRRRPPQPPKVDEPAAASTFAGKHAQLPQVVSRGGEELLPLFKPRYRAAKIIAYGVSVLGVAAALTGTVAAVLAGAGGVEPVSAIGSYGLPIGLVVGRADGAGWARAAARRTARGRGVRHRQRQPRNARNRARPAQLLAAEASRAAAGSRRDCRAGGGCRAATSGCPPTHPCRLRASPAGRRRTCGSATPPQARDWMVEVSTCLNEIW